MKKRLAFACAVLLLATLFSVGSFSESENEPILPTGDFFPLKQPVTLTVLTMNIAGNLKVADSYVLDWIKEKTNITLDIRYELYGSDGEAQLSMMMASDEKLPDILLCTRWTKAECALYGAQGLVVPLDEYLKDCDNWNALTKLCGERHVSDLMMPDGHIYCFGSVNECFHVTHQARMWVYQPWIDLLCGGKLPTTTDEFYDYLRKVATQDPNGNGIRDEIPLTGQIMDGWASDPFTFLSNSFVHNNLIQGNTNLCVAPGVYLEDGIVRCNWTQDAYREALRYMHRLYQEGLLDSQTYLQNGEQMGARAEYEPHLVGAAPGGLMPNSGAVQPGEPDDLWENWTCLPPLEGPDGVRLCYQGEYDYFYNCNGLITKDCAYPEIAAQLFDLLSSTEGTLVQSYGKEGHNWEYCSASDGEAMNGETPLYRRIPRSDPDDAAKMGYSSMLWPSDVQIGSATLGFRNSLLMDENGERELLLWQWAELYDPYSPGMDTVYPNIAYTVEQSQKIAQYGVSIDSYVKNAAVQFIMGRLDLDRDWDSYLVTLESMDQAGYQKLLQEAYDAYRVSTK